MYKSSDNNKNICNLKSNFKFITWNSARKNISPSLDSELSNLTQYKLICVNETSVLYDVSKFNLVGYRHSNKVTRGLSVYINKDLQHHSSVNQSDFTIYGYIAPPPISNNNAKTMFSKIGYVCSYRSPSLSDLENETFFNDLYDSITKFKLQGCELVCSLHFRRF